MMMGKLSPSPSVVASLPPAVCADAVVLTTDHDRFDYEMIRENAAIIVDTRGKYRAQDPKVVKA